jgi:hypothetical protein
MNSLIKFIVTVTDKDSGHKVIERAYMARTESEAVSNLTPYVRLHFNVGVRHE